MMMPPDPITPRALARPWWLVLVLIAGEAFIVTAVAIALTSYLVTLVPAASWLETVLMLVVSGMIYAVWLGLRRWLERDPAPKTALGDNAKELAVGMAGGAAVFGAITAVVAAMGGFEVLGVRGQGELWTMLRIAIFSGVVEEILFRGIILRHLESLTGSWIAVGITAALFGGAHLMNADATAFAAIAIAVEAGLLLGAVWVLTRRLWAAIGLHAAWNFTQGWVFSIPVSGGDAPLGLLITRRIGPDWLTGGAFGLEASAVALVVAGLAGAMVMRVAAKHGYMQPPRWAVAHTKL